MPSARAEPAPDWPAERVQAFARYQAAHPHPQKELERVHQRTAALIAAYRAPPSPNAALDAPPLIWRARGAQALWDSIDFPELVVIPAGEYTMGSSAAEPHRRPDEGPRHRVRIAHAFAVSRYPITVAEFAHFVAETGYDTGNTCKTFEGGAWDDQRPNRSWRNPGYAQSPADPAVCINWNDAQAYVAWIAKRTGHPYRLLTEAEYEYANRAGTVTAYWWGDTIGGSHTVCDACEMAKKNTETAPVGSFAPNAFGLHDTTGNAWSWVADCWSASYETAPADGSANLSGDCTQHAERGGAWYYIPGSLRSAIRAKDLATLRNYHNGFRVALTL